MSRENFVVCNRAGCGKRVSPPENAGWVSLMVVAPNGIQFADSIGDLCAECRGDVMRFINTERDKRRIVQ